MTFLKISINFFLIGNTLKTLDFWDGKNRNSLAKNK